MNVVCLSFSFGEYCIPLASGLAEAGANVLLLLPSQEAEGHTSKLHPRVKLRTFQTPRLRQPWAQLKLTRWLVSVIHQFQPDVVHYQIGQLWFNLLALPALKRYPRVVTIHDPHYHAGDQSSQRTPERVTKMGYTAADHIIVHSERLKPDVMQLTGASEACISVVPLVVFGDAPGTPPAQLPPAPQTPHLDVLFFGRIWPYKGLEYLIEAEPAISARVPHARIVIAGEGEDFARYQAMMTNPDHFLVLNEYISNDLRADLFATASVVVLPYVEASQSGVAPIALSLIHI